MAFEALTHRWQIRIGGFEEKWIPVSYLYDPDLPLFPVMYFHRLDPSLDAGVRPSEEDRIFGFLHRLEYSGSDLIVTLITNKDPSDNRNKKYEPVLLEEINRRLGNDDPVKLAQIAGAFTGKYSPINHLVTELWHKVAGPVFGKSLPFGKSWDEVYGLVRWIASFNSPGGRKSELIQHHDFVRSFGKKVSTGSGVYADFYLLPTYQELTDYTINPLHIFPEFKELMEAADAFVKKFCTVKKVGSHSFSSFNRLPGQKGYFDNDEAIKIYKTLPTRHFNSLLSNWGAFDRGPHRSVISLMMLHDIANGTWNPSTLTSTECADFYKNLSGTWQSPKVLALYAQQCFGSASAMPIDSWVDCILEHPFAVKLTGKSWYAGLFGNCSVLGKIERLIWHCVQGRKVHASVCSDILWCVRFGGTDKELRGPNPLSCKICSAQIRDKCPGYDKIKKQQVFFNATSVSNGEYIIKTSAGNNHTPNQRFETCERTAKNKKDRTKDIYSSKDEPSQFTSYPASGHAGGSPLSVDDFIQKY